MEFKTVRSSELERGDVVREHGMRVRLDELATYESGQSAPYDTVYSWRGTVLNLAEVHAAGIVPASFLWDDFHYVTGEGHVPARRDAWTVQGNDLATWRIELPDPGPGIRVHECNARCDASSHRSHA